MTKGDASDHKLRQLKERAIWTRVGSLILLVSATLSVLNVSAERLRQYLAANVEQDAVASFFLPQLIPALQLLIGTILWFWRPPPEHLRRLWGRIVCFEVLSKFELTVNLAVLSGVAALALLVKQPPWFLNVLLVLTGSIVLVILFPRSFIEPKKPASSSDQSRHDGAARVSPPEPMVSSAGPPGAGRPKGQGSGPQAQAARSDNLGVATVTLLMTEHEQLTASFLANEEMGERRVNIFIGVIAAVMTAVGFVAKGPGAEETLPKVAAGASAVLLAFGLVTLRRVIERNLVTTEYLDGLCRIRLFFARQEPNLRPVLPYPPDEDPIVRERKSGLRKGGHLQTVAVINCVLAALLMGTSIRSWNANSDHGWTIAFSLGALVLLWFLQMCWTDRHYKEGTAKRDRKRKESEAKWDQ